MTENELRQSLVRAAQAWYGCRESDGSHRKIIDLYNAHKPLARNYRVRYTDAWCATFVSAAAIAANLTDILPTECGCDRQIALFKNMGRWQENDAYVPRPGDVIYYDWNDNGAGDCTGASDHVGIVTACDGKTVTVIEGNIANAVGYRKIAVNGRYIRGYGVPDYAGKADKSVNKDNDKSFAEAFTKAMDNYRKSLQTNESRLYSAAAREWAVENGLITGSQAEGEPFNGMWEDFLTREQFVTVLYRFAKYIGKI